MTDTFIIAGGGLAGAKAAETLREEGFEGRVLLVGEESERPYERPPLSKEYLRGESGREELYVHAASLYEEQGIELRLGEAATSLEADARELELSGGERIAFDRLLLATGAEPRKLPVPGADLDGVHYLRSVESSDAIRERLEKGGRVVVIGGGWIGSEAAASARQHGLEVTLIEPAGALLERVLGSELGAVYGQVHEEHGVELALGTGVEALEGTGKVERVRTSDGRSFDCDFAIVGIGVEPRTELAAAAGLDVDNGVLVDANLQASAPGVFAAGDIARHRHPTFGPLRVEHWANALNQGPAAARNMLGRDEPYDRVPYFFSDQYDVGMEYCGYATSWDRVVFRGDPASREFIAFWLREGRLLAAMNVNVWDVNETLQSIVAGRPAIDAAALEDPEVALESLLSGKA
ncbi:MAG TPA: FAD-dependent oxidoreductase [Solirubrobacterales bacterium]|nr:FAD-dependent oxidoreductase [Solirubrobacterales bacterium]